MFYSNTLNLIQVGGGTQVKQGDLGSKFSYKLANEKDQELDDFDKEVAHIDLVLDDKIVFTTTATVDNSTVTFNIDKAIPVGLYFLEIKIRDYIFPSDKQTIIFVQSGAVAYDLKELVPNYDTNMTIKGILSDLSQKGIDIRDLENKTTAQLAQKANKDEVTNVMTPKGTLAYASLPTSGNQVGWYYYCPDGDGTHGAGNYVWNGTSWFFGGTGDEGYNLLKKDIDKLEAVTDLYGSMYIMDGYYNNGVHNQGAHSLSRHYDVVGYDKITATITTSKYYDIYDFLDDSFTVISYKRENGSSKTIEITLNVPDNAKYFVVNGEFTEKTVVKGAVQLKNEQKLHNIEPVAVLNGYWNKDRNAFEYSSGYHYSLFDVSLYKRGQIEADAFQYSKAVVLLDENKSLIQDLNSDMFYHGNGHYKISVGFEGAAYVGVSTKDNKVPIVNVLTKKIKKEQNLFGKSIVWFGTSIPAAGLYGLNNENAYPNRVGKILSANVMNEAVGSSVIACKSPDRITESNPYGFTHDFEACSRCLTNTIEEMNWIIEHYNDSSVFDYRTVSSLSESDKDFIRSCSYENKLLPYLTSTKCPDLFVFDHGHNDSTNDKKESYYSETVKINGTEENGWYSSGVYQESQYKESIKFDVSNYSQVLLSGRIGAWRDVYDLFDENGHNIGFEKVNTGVSVSYENKEIDVSGAKYLVVSNDNNLLNTVSLKGYKYDRNHNLYCYQGAMRFLLNLIFSFNPKQRVVMIGEYENEKQPYIAKYQNKVADEWNLPIYRQWEEYGWSNNKIKTKWHWDNGVWTLGKKEQTITILNCWLADTVHPHSDRSGKTLQFMADHIASWMKDNIFLLN